MGILPSDITGKPLIPQPKIIITYGAHKRYQCDIWYLPEKLRENNDYLYCLDIIDHFSKYIMSFPVVNNNAENVLNCFKEFCILKGYPKILQSDNGVEFKKQYPLPFTFEYEYPSKEAFEKIYKIW